MATSAPGAFHGLCDHLGLAPRQVLYIADDYTVAVLGADAAGLTTAYLDRTGVGPLSEADRIESLVDGLPEVELLHSG